MTVGGGYNRRFYVEQPVAVRNTTGEETITWQIAFARWARVKPSRGSEQLQGALQVVNAETYEVRMRMDSRLRQLTTKWRLMSTDGSKLNILSVSVHDRDPHELVMTCKDSGE